jgi:hypothetical protein
LRTVARDAERTGEWYGALPIIPGAMHARLQGSRLEVRAPIPRDRAYVSLVTERERLGGAIVPLTPDDSGGASGTVDLSQSLLSRLLATPSWAVVSSQLDKRSPGVVGWPIARAHLPSVPPLTFDVGDHVLLDGSEQALAIDERERRRRRRWGALLLVGVGVAMSGLFWYDVHPRSGAGTRGIQGASARANLPPTHRGWAIWLALACILIALAALAYFGSSVG